MIELEGVDPSPHISINNYNYKQLQQTIAKNDKVTDDRTRRCGSIPTYFKKQLHL